jgi:hypothetical protein
MMKIAIRIDNTLLDNIREFLPSQNIPPRNNDSLMIEDALKFFLHNTTSKPEKKKKDIIKDGKQLAKERLHEAGIGEPHALGNYTKGMVHVWAKRNKVMKQTPDDPRQINPILDEALKEVIIETTRKEQEFIKPREELFRDDDEEITPPTYTSDVPPWQGLKKIKWDEVNELYANPRDNPFLLYSKNKDGTWNEIRREAIMTALAQLPPKDRTSQEAWKLVRDLEERFKGWQDVHST